MILSVSDRVLTLGLHELRVALVEPVLGNCGAPLHLTLLDQICSLLLKDTPVMDSLLQLGIVKSEIIDGIVLALFLREFNFRLVEGLLDVMDLNLLNRILGIIILGKNSLGMDNHIFGLVTSYLLIWVA